MLETPSPPPPDFEPIKRARRTEAWMSLWWRDLIIAVGIAAFIIVFLYQPVKVEGISMMPSLDDQERIFINKFVYRIESIEPGDVVVFRYPHDTSISYIKRVIGVAGDRVRIESGRVFVNSTPLIEDYVAGGFADDDSYPEVV